MKYWKSFQKDDIHLSPVECGSEKYMHFQVYEYIVRRKYVIHFVTEGSGYLEINHKQYRLEENTGFILRQNQHVKYYPEHESSFNYYWLGISGSSLDSVLEKTILSKQDIFTFDHQSEALNLLIKMIHYNRKNTESLQMTLKNKAFLFNFAYQLSQEFLDETKVDISLESQDTLSNLIIDYIYEHYTENIKVQEIADHFNISRSYLYKICDHNFEKAPQEIILRERVRNASQLLLHTNLLVKDIAERVGYNNPFHFSKAFKNYYGYSPSEFRTLDTQLLDELVE